MTSSKGDACIRALAGPLRRPCVANAKTRNA
eukprot:CAMPEP_0185915730 /NCGR_PEP_ID=MMETSP0924C-20121207/2711_1 /TAXON_ID=321610 /ORGANISM="Perkinsus chesapeaki, Strain ATCC PRA-65" /LENGTH=30 /DNA_ID= /DNA_START= /DNA_END= /DNA_ORIENTATION=